MLLIYPFLIVFGILVAFWIVLIVGYIMFALLSPLIIAFCYSVIWLGDRIHWFAYGRDHGRAGR